MNFVCVCSWTTSGLKSQGRLSVGSNRDREISMAVGLGRSKLDSKGGVVGGNIDVNTLEMVCKYTPQALYKNEVFMAILEYYFITTAVGFLKKMISTTFCTMNFLIYVC